MERFLASHSPEAVAHSQFCENYFGWDVDHSSFDEALVAGCASYRAIDRYLSGADLFILPRNRSELESILRRYCYDAIHNAISRSKATLETGGYSRVCHLAEESISQVLNTGDNTSVLLSLHCINSSNANNHQRPGHPNWPIKTT
ncbi:hypothetical protein D9758_001031 [Tetrapyrgos nigripes]|uniref:Uncharacterized protein n=1 Tax=Tetrapyrgos nigripes TaxID=182062 RepID=A0A8H5GSC0_9AGAR|nr:hypothetical protein D9758_001031 [Tetrapyrgos nigripes]